MKRIIASFALACALLFSCAGSFAEEIRDYYAEPGLNPFKDSINQHFNEHVDPFSGTLQLKYTDLSIPGNGGMDLNVTRVYTSLQTNQYPTLGLNGLGWVMHFGRIVTSRSHADKLCNQGAYPTTTKENLSLELPDGGRELLVLNHINNDGSLITRSNWRARCLSDASGLLVTSPDGTKYTMNQPDSFQGEPSWFTTRIEDLQGNWIRIDYRSNAAGVAYVHEIYRSEEGSSAPIASYEYYDETTAGIKLKAIVANGQRTEYRYQTIPGFILSAYQQLVEVKRPDGRTWEYSYNPKLDDPDPNDGVREDGPASFSLVRVKYPYGATIDYTYRYVQFDPGSAERTTTIHTKTTNGGGIPGATWTYGFAPHSSAFPDGAGGSLNYDVTTVTGPHDIQKFYHFGKDYRGVPGGGQIFVRPALVGLLAKREVYDTSNRLLERSANSWGVRLVSNEDFWHGAGYRDWWKDNGTYAPVLIAQYVNRDARASEEVYYHYRQYFEYDAYGNPGRTYENTNIVGTHAKQTRYSYFIDTTKWIVQRLEDEVHEEVPDGGAARVLGSIERTFDDNGKLKRAVAFGVQTDYTYTPAGDLASVRNARGNIQRFSLYKRGIAQREEMPEDVVVTRVVNETGTVASEKNGRGYLTSFAYDDLNRLIGIDFPIKSDVTIAYSSADDGFRRTLTRGTYQQAEVISDFGQVLRTERRDTATGEVIYRTKRFDASGREVFTSYPSSTAGISTSYDALGRVRRTEHPDGAGVDYAYDEAEVTVTNERRFATKYRYLVRGVDFDGQALDFISAPEQAGTIIRRDTLGNTTEIFQGEVVNQNTVRGYGKNYEYDARQRLVRSVEPEVGTTIFEHDEVGNVLSERVNDAAPVTFAYDGLNRRTRVDFSDATPDVVTIYDANSNVERITKGSTQWVYAYDEDDNLRSETLQISHPLFASRTYALQHSYNDLDVVSQTTYPTGLIVDYAPDGFGRATRVGSFASNIVYHPSGQVASYRLANGVVTNVALDPRLRTRAITAPGMVDLTYGYDVSGNVMRITDGVDASKNVTMSASSYDGLDRLRSAAGAWGGTDFTYDHQGNIRRTLTNGASTSYRLDASWRVQQLHQTQSSALRQLTRLDFDARGNATAKRRYNYDYLLGGAQIANFNDAQFIYDSASHLVKAKVTSRTPSGATRIADKDYWYDGNGQRVLEHKHGSYDARFSVYSRLGQLMFEDSLAECVRTDYIRLGALNIARSDDRTAVASLDTDGDLIPDCMEAQLGLNPNAANDAAADADADGLTNLQEYRAGTSLIRSDTDGDGLSDRDELNAHLTDPNVTDSDGDGIADGAEAADPRLDPKLGDKDHDGVSDFWELALRTDPSNPADGMLDSDADGFSNRQESMSGSDPLRATSVPSRGRELWASDTFGAVYGNAAIGKDRTVYVAATDGRLYAFNPDGTQRWAFAAPIPGSVVSDPAAGPDGTVYIVVRINGGLPVGSPRSFIYALRQDGTTRWTQSTTDFLNSRVTIGVEGRLYVGGFRLGFNGATGIVLALDASGRITHSRAVPGDANLSAAVSANGDVYVVDSQGVVHALTSTLTVRWTYSMRHSGSAPPSVGHDGSVYVGDFEGNVYALTAAGALRWEQHVSQGPLYSSIVIGAEGVLYLGGYDSRMVALDAAEGTQRWTTPTTATVFTPAVAANGDVYAITSAGDLYAFDAAGAVRWTLRTGDDVDSAPVIDRDGTLYFGSITGQLYAVADNGGGPARTAWPMERHDSAGTSYVCFNEPAFSFIADTDGDRIDDCAELRYGLNPSDSADGAADMDGDGLRNADEHERGTRLDAVDTDGDGLSDGQEVLTYRTNPLAADTDHDTLSDAREIEMRTNPLDSADAGVDSDGDGYTNRQEIWANTDLLNASSTPTPGQLAREETNAAFDQRLVAVGRDGTIYQSSSKGLEALHPDFAVKWTWPTPIVGAPAIGPDGTIFVATARSNDEQRLVALLPNAAVRWAVTFRAPASDLGLFDGPAVAPNGNVYIVETSSDPRGDFLHAFDSNGVRLTEWGNRGAQVFARQPKISIDSQNRVVVYDPVNALTLRRANNGSQLWRYSMSGAFDYAQFSPVIGPDDTIYVRGQYDLRAVNLTNGMQRWRLPNASGSPLITADNRVITYCATGQRDLCAVDPASGAVIWTDSNDYSYVGIPTLDANGSILVLTNNSLFMAFNPDGTVRWQTPVAATSSAHYPVVLSDGTIYVSASSRRLVLIGNGRGLAAAPWPARDRDHKNSRHASGIVDVEPNPAPSLSIVSPAAASVRVDVGQAIAATAVAADFADGDLSAAIRWTSSLDGELATGPSVPLGGLSVGTHTITATVTDSSDLTASATRSVQVGVFSPEVEIFSPGEGSTFDRGENILIGGTATDVMDGDISNGLRWTSDRDGALGAGQQISRADLSVGAHRITATSVDSTGRASEDSVNITVQVLPPVVQIYNPGEGQEFELGTAVNFYGYAYDGVDGTLSASIRWSSNLEGDLGVGEFLTVDTLRLGTHIITATASDSGGATTTASQTIVVRYLPPQLNVVSPPSFSTIQAGENASFYATASDLADGDLTASINWTSSLDGLLGTGGEVERDDLSVGRHQITVSVTDSAGQTASQQRQVNVQSATNSAPFVSISAPETGAQVYLTDPVTMTASAFDNQDGQISNTIQWSSNLDGAVGTGASVTTSALRLGVHTLRAFSVDSGGAKAAATVQLTVLPIPANYPPTIRITSIGVGARYTISDAFALTGIASDREEGDLSSRLEWQSNRDGALGTGSTIWVSGLSAGVHEITARVSDAYGNITTLPRTIEVFADGEALLLDDSFSVTSGPKALAGWVSFDDGTTVPSRWTLSGGALAEFGNAQAGSTAAAAIEKPGTYMRQTAGAYWLDYRVNVSLRSTDNDALGLMFRYIDNNNYYRFSMDAERSYRRLVRKVNGVYTLLWSDATPYVVGQTYQLEVIAQGSNITISLDGTVLYNGTDSSHRHGTIALYAWSESAAYFDNVRVTNLRTVDSNDAPVLAVASPANGQSFQLGSAVTLSASAIDLEDGSLSGSVTWSSSLDGPLGSGASLSVSSLREGAHTITASVTDSKGRTTTATRTITIVTFVNQAPVVTITAPASGATYTAGDLISFAATATDAEDGNLTGLIEWSSSINGVIGSTGQVSTSTLSAGTHTITASVRDSIGATHSRTISITVQAPRPTLLSDNFSDNNFNGWTVVTESGTLSGPGAWSASTGALRQTSGVYSDPTTAATVPKRATYIHYTAGSSWTNYTAEADLRSTDADAFGIMFRYQNSNNYYRFSMDRTLSQRRLVKRVGGTSTVLREDSTRFNTSQTYRVSITVNGSSITVLVDGVQFYSGTDSGITSGSVAMYTWRNSGATFDNIVVRGFAQTADSRAPDSSLESSTIRLADSLRAIEPMFAGSGLSVPLPELQPGAADSGPIPLVHLRQAIPIDALLALEANGGAR